MNHVTPLIEARCITREFSQAKLFAQKKVVHALDEVSLAVERGQTLGILGESGCGKSTLARILSGLDRPTAGEVLFDGEVVSSAKHLQRRVFTNNVQMIFQDPYSSLNPRMTIREILLEPLRGAQSPELKDRKGLTKLLNESLDQVGMPTAALERYPHQFSGGQRQRVGIARALMTRPRVLVCDEAVSALDVSIQAQILKVLADLRDNLDLTMIFVSHNVAVVGNVADQIAVMYLGKVVEFGETRELLRSPRHPYTSALISAVPGYDHVVPGLEPGQRIQGEVPSPMNRPTGCAFQTRCWRATEECLQTSPSLTEQGSSEHLAACFHALNEADYESARMQRGEQE